MSQHDEQPLDGGLVRTEPAVRAVRDAIAAETQRKLTTAPNRATTLPTDPAERKKYPVATGFLDYFPDAVVAVSHVSWRGNQQHNPGQPLHWARGKSMDQDDTTLRHFLERGGGNVEEVSGYDTDGVLHRAKAAWRAMAALQLEIEQLQKEGRLR